MVRDCFEVEAGSDPYTSSEVVSNLQAGVRVGLVFGRHLCQPGAKVSFDVPAHHTLERLAMIPTAACAAMLSNLSAVEKSTMYAVHEVLTAVITKQQCGQVDAKGRFVQSWWTRSCLLRAARELSAGCRCLPECTGDRARMPLPPRAWRSCAQAHSLSGATPMADEGCRWGDIDSVYTTLATLTLNGQQIDVRSIDKAWVATELQRCGYISAAEAFNDWRDSRRTTNIACATIAGCYPFGVGIVSAVNAKKHRLRMERALLSAPDGPIQSVEPKSMKMATKTLRVEPGLCQIESGAVSEQKTVWSGACALGRDDGSSGHFNIASPEDGEILPGIMSISVHMLESGEAEVRGVTTAGVASRWGSASRDLDNPSCWKGVDFRVCVQPQ